MKRRAFITLLGGAAATWPLAARAQQAPKLVRIGILAGSPLPLFQRFSRKLQELGYIEGQNLRFEYRFSGGDNDRCEPMAAELVALDVSVIVTLGTPAALAAKQATRAIPIVMGASGDPVHTGIVSNLARPDANITGFASQNVDLEGKRLELLKEFLPHVSRVGLLANTTNPLFEASLKYLRPAGEALAVTVEVFEARDDNEIDDALRRLDQAHPDAVLVAPDLLLLTKRKELVAAFAKSNLPAIYPFREFAEAGGLLVHGANLGILFERAAGYVDRILKGAKPSELPIQLATEFELIINLKTARALGLEVPPTLLARADEVIE